MRDANEKDLMSMENQQIADISEDFIEGLSLNMLKILLQDFTKSSSKKYAPIFWATDDYRHLGPDYAYDKPILPELITGRHDKVVQPRIVKSKTVQTARSKEMAEVFTPSWVCNLQNNQIDAVWFGREEVFNREIPGEKGERSWKPTTGKIVFPSENSDASPKDSPKDWKAYVADVRIEISCGEAPYVVSRYDATTGAFIPVERRIGILDRKLRIVSENTTTAEEWFFWAEKAYKATYGYEWQGDNLLLAREALLVTLLDYFEAKFHSHELPTEKLEHFAEIVSWNFWQMDGLKGVVPDSCIEKEEHLPDLFGGDVVNKVVCEGCAKGDIDRHNGLYCKIKDWNLVDSRTQKPGKIIRFIDTLK